MRTEIVKIIEGLLNEDTEKVEAYVKQLEHNYLNNKIIENDKSFAKRVLRIFFNEDERYSSEPVFLDRQ